MPCVETQCVSLRVKLPYQCSLYTALTMLVHSLLSNTDRPNKASEELQTQYSQCVRVSKDSQPHYEYTGSIFPKP